MSDREAEDLALQNRKLFDLRKLFYNKYVCGADACLRTVELTTYNIVYNSTQLSLHVFANVQLPLSEPEQKKESTTTANQ